MQSFISGTSNKPYDIPLSRFLPPLPPGMIRSWLSERAAPGDWVLDPFGSHPMAAIEAAQAGQRVLVAVNNPITRFLLEIQACAPHPSDFEAALADLAAARKGDERLEKHIPNLYETNCSRCGRTVSAQAFLWENGASVPFGRIYTCPECGESGEQPVTEADITRLKRLPPSALHRSRALERVVSIDDPLRPDVEEAIQVYLPRALYVLFTLINKLETLPLAPARKGLLTALLLSVCDEADNLWPYPSGRTRPRQLSNPQKFRENNLWNILEERSAQWVAYLQSPLTVTIWPEQAPAGGITLFPGRFRDLGAGLKALDIRQAYALFPRPNQAFWTLSALWTGWLWGRETAAALKPVLNRKRYDWAWHSMALHTVLETMRTNLPADASVFGIIPETEPSFLTAAAAAAEQSGFTIDGIISRDDQEISQIFLQNKPVVSQPISTSRETVFRSAIQDLFDQVGEPVSTLSLYGAALSRLGKHKPVAAAPQEADAGDVQEISHTMQRILNDKSFLIRYGSAAQSTENAYWWPRQVEEQGLSQMDRVETEVFQILQNNPGLTSADYDRRLCHDFPGAAAPAQALIFYCLESYGVIQDGRWSLRPEDRPSAREEDVRRAAQALAQIGQSLGYLADGTMPVQWRTNQGQLVSVFWINTTSQVGQIIFKPEIDPQTGWIVLPGGRSNLLAYKLEHHPRLANAAAKGWRFIKFRRLFELLHTPALTQGNWAALISEDAPVYHPSRLDF